MSADDRYEVDAVVRFEISAGSLEEAAQRARELLAGFRVLEIKVYVPGDADPLYEDGEGLPDFPPRS